MSLHRFDHAAAKAWYVSLDPGERSSRAVAEKFAVSETTISKWRRLEKWDDAADEADRAASVAVQRQAVKTREQRALQSARIRDLAAQRLEDQLADEEAEIAIRDAAAILAAVDKIVRLDEGRATDHVEIAVFHATIRNALGAACDVAFEVGGEALRRRMLELLPGRLQERVAAELPDDDDGTAGVPLA